MSAEETFAALFEPPADDPRAEWLARALAAGLLGTFYLAVRSPWIDAYLALSLACLAAFWAIVRWDERRGDG